MRPRRFYRVDVTERLICRSVFREQGNSHGVKTGYGIDDVWTSAIRNGESETAVVASGNGPLIPKRLRGAGKSLNGGDGGASFIMPCRKTSGQNE